MKPLCAICGMRVASQTTDWDDRIVHACAECLEPPPDIPWQDHVADAVQRAKRDPWSVVTDDEMQIGSGTVGDGARSVAIVKIVQQRPGITMADIAEAVGLSGSNGQLADAAALRAYRRVAQMIHRMAKSGKIRREGKVGSFSYWPVDEQQRAA